MPRGKITTGPCVQTGAELLTTDQPDYAPADTVHVTGGGFGLTRDVHLQITRPEVVVATADVATEFEGSLGFDYVLPPQPSVIGMCQIDAVDGG